MNKEMKEGPRRDKPKESLSGLYLPISQEHQDSPKPAEQALSELDLESLPAQQTSPTETTTHPQAEMGPQVGEVS